MKTLTALIPFFNEERTLAELVRQLSNLPNGTLECSVFVNDGSTDRSLSVLETALKQTVLPYVIIVKENGGKASAIKEGSKVVKTSHVVILDSDLELATNDISKLWAIVLENESEFVFGFRKFLSQSSFTWRYSRGNQFISNLYGFFFNEVITDIMCGYKLIPTSNLQKLPYRYRKFGVEIEIPMHMWQQRQRPYEVEVSYKARSRSEGKSISVKDAIAVILSMALFRITHRRKS